MANFGIFLSGEELGPGEIVRYAQFAESLGFERIWISDHYHPWLTDQGESPFIWSVLGAVAATTKLHLTTAVTCPSYRIHPAILAQAAATVTVMAPGRFSFGVGSGEKLNEHILGDAWLSAPVRQERFAEAVEVIRKLWTGETVRHQGRFFTVDAARLFTLPENPPPILVSGFGPESTQLAARIGDGYINVQPAADLISLYRQSGGKGVVQGGMKFCYAESERQAAETAYRLWGHETVGGQAAQELPSWTEFESLREASSPEQIAQSVPCGPDPDKVIEAVREYVDAGYDEVYLSQMGPDQEGGIRFLAEQVLPKL